MGRWIRALMGDAATSPRVEGFANSRSGDDTREMAARLRALNASQAVIEFTPAGEILTANDNFLAAVGYSLDEIRGRHHSMFVEPAYAASNEYREFWEKLGSGQFHSGRYKRVAKGGREIWIQASYNPVLDVNGKPWKVVKYASDVTAEQLRNADLEGRASAIDRSQAVIEFTLDGVILDANRNFLEAVGYTREEIVGKHHRMFVDPIYGQSDEYREFWRRLGQGRIDAGRYQRFGKGGKSIWIQATYNPILDATGKPIKLVKFAQDITAQVAAAKALEGAVAEMQALAANAVSGDLTSRIAVGDKSGDVLALCGAVNQLVDEMESIVTRIRDASGSIEIAAKEIASGNSDLSSRTEEQASSLEETASSMETLTATVRQNAENAKQASQLVVGASEVAQRGGQVVREVVTTMGGISDSSKKIADIISVIDGIAFQTNILALNAAVEAARAGEQGRGFAVVATEVRNLAQRSAGAAKEIRELISDSVGKVESGSKLVDEAGRTMEDIVASVKRVTDIMQEIAAASAEQSAGIEQVNQAIAQMDEVTQQNAALVEQAAAAAESLEEQAEGLSRSVSAFRVGESGEPVATRRDVPTASQGERRSPDRAHNVSRLRGKGPTNATSVRRGGAGKVVGGGEQWSEF